MHHLFVALLTCTLTAACSNPLVPLDQVFNDFKTTKDYRLFAKRKHTLYTYYTSQAYENEVANLCRQAREYFATIPAHPRSVIIFDIDDTAVYNYQWHNDAYFIWGWSFSLLTARLKGKAPAIKPVFELYQFLLNKGFTIIFVSARSLKYHTATLNELRAAGYTRFAQLILRPPHSRSHQTKGMWKHRVRQKLAHHYTIVGCIGDKATDFEGGLTGYTVQLPNYLY